jgi:hypothetical protein
MGYGIMMKKDLKVRYDQTGGLEIEESGGIETPDPVLKAHHEAQAGKFRSTGRGADDEWVETRSSRYHQLLNKVSEVEGAQMPESDLEAELKLLMKAATLLKSICKLTLADKPA